MNDSQWSSRFSQAGARTRAPEISWLMAQALQTPGLVSLAAGFVDQESLPHEAVSAELRSLLGDADIGRAMLQYGTTQGDAGLRRQLCSRLRDEGVFHADAGIDENHFIVGSGSQQILYLACEALIDEGDIILVEAPTYFVVLGAFETRGARTVGIDVDEYGLVPESLEDALQRLDAAGELHRVKMLYLMTYAGNPHGVTLREERRGHVINILRRYRDNGHFILLLEDAAYRRLNFDEPPAPLKAFDRDNDFVLYTESFSKSLSPGLRLGFGAGPRELIDKLVHIKGNHDFGSSHFNQSLLSRLIETGGFDRHIETLRAVYQRKCGVALEALREHMPPEAEFRKPDGGFYIWTTLPEGIDTGGHGPVFEQALAEKVLYVPGALCFSPDRAESKGSSTMRLSFGQINDADLVEGCRRLSNAIAAIAANA